MKKEKQLLKSLISLVVAVCLCCSISMFPISVEAAAADIPMTADTMTASRLSVTSETMVGNLLANTMDNNEQQTLDSCYVAELDITDSTAQVTFQTVSDSIVVVGIYTEDQGQLLASGMARVTMEQDSIALSLAGDIPEYFIASAYLLDAEGCRPLSKKYTTQRYTKALQELRSKTTEDFDPALVVNLDANTDTNFAVLPENAVICEENGDQNILTQSGQAKYTITNVDGSAASLQPGNVFAYKQADDMLVIVVESVLVNGSTVTITEKTNAELADAFEYIKIEAESSSGTIAADNGTLQDSVSSEGESQTLNRRMGTEQSGSGSFHYILDKNIGLNATVRGPVDIAATEKLDLLIAGPYTDITFKIEFEVSTDLTLEGTIRRTNIQLGNIIFSPMAGVFIEFTPSIVLSTEGSLGLRTQFDTAVGLSYDVESGFHNMSSAPRFHDNSFNISGTCFLGLSLTPRIKILSDRIGVSVQALMGAQLKGEMSASSPSSAAIRHDCTACIDGEISIRMELSASVDFLGLTKVVNFSNLSYRLADFYYSLDHNEGGFGTCPHYAYRVTIFVLNDAGDPLPEATISDVGQSILLTTDAEGKAIVYLYNGIYELCAVVGEDAMVETLEVQGSEERVAIVICQDPLRRCGQNVSWELENGRLSITGTGDMWNYASEFFYTSSIPNRYVPWYNHRDEITSVHVGPGVTSIGAHAFESCSQLSDVSIPDSVTTIKAGVFSFCSSLRTITIPDGVRMIDINAFYRCSNLANIVMPEGLMSIENSVFLGCSSLTSLEIPSSVTYIGDQAFSGCSSLISLSIPEKVTSIGLYAFSSCKSLRNISLPDKLTSIGQGAFLSCSSLNTIIIPDQVTSVEPYTFSSCFNMTDIKLPDGLTSVGSSAFATCHSLKTITIPNNVTHIGSHAFSQCHDLRSVTLPEKLTAVGEQTFMDCENLTSIVIPDNVTSIGPWAFSKCYHLKEAILPDKLTSLGNAAFESCSRLESIKIPDGMTSIDEFTFSLCGSLVDVAIPNSMTSIGTGAFQGCSSLESITIPDSVSWIGQIAFSWCTELKDVYYTGSEAAWNAIHVEGGNDFLIGAQIHYIV